MTQIKKGKKYWTLIGLILIGMVMMLFSCKVNAQGYFGMSGTNKGLGVQAGALIKKQVDVQMGYITRLSSNAEKPTMFYAAIGKRFVLWQGEERLVTLTPMVGISTTSYSTFTHPRPGDGPEVKETDSSTIYFGTELGFDYKQIRPFISISKSTFTYFGAGVKIFIVLRNSDEYSPAQRRSY